MKVFLSSVVGGLEIERKVACDAIETLGHSVIRCENFGASVSSSQEICLRGVEAADLFLGIVGGRFGSKTSSGKSICQEEYEHSRQLGIPSLWFVMKDVEMEAEQSRFLDLIRDYETGHAFASFSNTHELAIAVVKSLQNRPHSENNSKTTNNNIRPILEEFCKSSHASSSDPGATLCLVTADRISMNLSNIDPVKLNRQIVSKILGSSSNLLDPCDGTSHTEGPEYIDLTSSSNSVTIRFFENGNLFIRTSLSQPNARSASSFGMGGMIIDRDFFLSRMNDSCIAASILLSDILEVRLQSIVYYTFALTNIENRVFGNSKVQSMNWGNGKIEEPLFVPTVPMQISVEQLSSPKNLTKSITAQATRAFRVAGKLVM